MNAILLLVLSLTLAACNAYRSTPETEVLFTKQDLVKKGFVLAPLADKALRDDAGVSDLNAFDTILANVLSETWTKPKLLTVAQITSSLDAEALETWRKQLSEEDQGMASVASIGVLKQLTKLGLSYPKQVLLPSLVQNTVSCGHKEAMTTYLSPKSRGSKNYCQRIMKMRFRIMATDSAELLWNGLVYATQETTGPIETDPKAEALEPPTTQALVRECFQNFARQFAEK